LPHTNKDKEKKIFDGKIFLFEKGLGQMALEKANCLSVEEMANGGKVFFSIKIKINKYLSTFRIIIIIHLKNK
jgi:hypothetical protein